MIEEVISYCEALITKGQAGAIVTVFRENQHGIELWSNVPHETLKVCSQNQLTSVMVNSIYTNCVVAKPRDVSFISSVKKDRPTFLPPLVIDQVAVVKEFLILEIEMVHLSEHMDSLIISYTMCYYCVYVAPAGGMFSFRRSNRR